MTKTLRKGKYPDLESHNPSLAQEAFGWEPSSASAMSREVRTWRCPKGHIWDARIDHRTRGSGCHYCTGQKPIPGVNDLATTHPILALEVLEEDPSVLAPGSMKQIKWKCPEGHAFEASLKNRTQGSKCPRCVSIAFLHPQLALELVGLDPWLIKAGSNRKVPWVCENGHQWSASPSSRVAGNGCSSCAKKSYDFNKPGYLYFLRHNLWGFLQIGITNHPQNRLSVHIRTGWEIITVRGPMDGVLVRELERDILCFLKESGADVGNKDIAGRFDGYTEAWVEESYPVLSLENLLEKVA